MSISGFHGQERGDVMSMPPMSNANLVIEPFTMADLGKVVQLHMISFTLKENFSSRLGVPFVNATYDFFVRDSKSFGFIAKYEEQVIGVLVGRLDYYTAALNRYRLRAALKALAIRPALVLDQQLIRSVFKAVSLVLGRKQGIKVERAPSHAPGRTATLASLCVHPDYRKFHVTDLLLSSAEELCRQKDMRFIRAGVRRSNIASRFTYRRRGYFEDTCLSAEDVLIYYLPIPGGQTNSKREKIVPCQ
jgi:ribosomal protein S18 acetylase RimI-like enzyme